MLVGAGCENRKTETLDYLALVCGRTVDSHRSSAVFLQNRSRHGFWHICKPSTSCPQRHRPFRRPKRLRGKRRVLSTWARRPKDCNAEQDHRRERAMDLCLFSSAISQLHPLAKMASLVRLPTCISPNGNFFRLLLRKQVITRQRTVHGCGSAFCWNLVCH